MHMRQRVSLALLVMPLIALVAATAFARSPNGRGGAQQCPLEDGVKLERAPWVYSGDCVVVAVCVKAGQERLSFDLNHTTDGCYTVTGIGTKHAEVTGGGTSRNCKDISNVVFYLSDCDGGLPG